SPLLPPLLPPLWTDRRSAVTAVRTPLLRALPRPAYPAVMSLGDAPLPAAFRRARECLLAARPRPEIELEDIPAPQRLAPYSAAIGATVYRRDPRGRGDEELAVGRLILLFDPDGRHG